MYYIHYRFSGQLRYAGPFLTEKEAEIALKEISRTTTTAYMIETENN